MHISCNYRSNGSVLTQEIPVSLDVLQDTGIVTDFKKSNR